MRDVKGLVGLRDLAVIYRAFLQVRVSFARLLVQGAVRPLTRRRRLLRGRRFHFVLRSLERQCAAQTDLALLGAGEKAPNCYSELGTVLDLLERLGSCWWRCLGGNHVPEYLVGRAVGDLLSAIQLLRLGYYDESLSLTRNAGEVVNLLQLFDNDRGALAEWQALPSRERWSRYRPAQVRKRLASSGQILISDERYSRLSEVASHATPSTRPQAHNPLGLPSQGPIFQLAGALVALNEAALVAVFLVIPATGLIDHGRGFRLWFLKRGRALAEQIGAATILEIDDYYETVRSALASSAA